MDWYLKDREKAQDKRLREIPELRDALKDKIGGPVRLIIPKMYAYKSVKWLKRIELIEEKYIRYWGQRGYENDAWVNG